MERAKLSKQQRASNLALDNKEFCMLALYSVCDWCCCDNASNKNTNKKRGSRCENLHILVWVPALRSLFKHALW